jgi:ribosomal protein L37AE/L43A
MTLETEPMSPTLSQIRGEVYKPEVKFEETYECPICMKSDQSHLVRNTCGHYICSECESKISEDDKTACSLCHKEYAEFTGLKGADHDWGWKGKMINELNLELCFGNSMHEPQYVRTHQNSLLKVAPRFALYLSLEND